MWGGIAIWRYCTSGKTPTWRYYGAPGKKLFGGTITPNKFFSEVPSWKFHPGKIKVIYQMKTLGFRLQRFTSESEIVAAPTVEGGAGQE